MESIVFDLHISHNRWLRKPPYVRSNRSLAQGAHTWQLPFRKPVQKGDSARLIYQRIQFGAYFADSGIHLLFQLLQRLV